jgi:hypothetical protein
MLYYLDAQLSQDCYTLLYLQFYTVWVLSTSAIASYIYSFHIAILILVLSKVFIVIIYN